MFELRDRDLAAEIVGHLRDLGVDLQFMHVCGTHQDTLVRHGLDALLADTGVRILQGPGCPVCVTTPREIEEAKAIAMGGAVVTTFGDMAAVPSLDASLREVRARGGDVRVVYSITEAVEVARTVPDRDVVFLSVGFETTAPTAAATVLRGLPGNMSLLSCHRTLPNALDAILSAGEIRLDGLIEPGHVSTITGTRMYEPLSERYGIPQVVAGFEPLDLLMAAYVLATMASERRAEVRNEYDRLVRPEGNVRAQEVMREVFRPVDVRWRGFPVIPGSGLDLRTEFDDHNARLLFEERLEVLEEEYPEPPGCRCGDVLRGVIEPGDCPLFAGTCTPRSPIGPCMVSAEGSCNITFKYGRRG
ncbi:MAG TPA: hydrogenase formation protein HypD [Thermoplasmata archaeon]|nr:hydrogenase formation protein HypD [Thermoplasmata archaeon]